MAGPPNAGLILFAAFVAVSRVAAATQFAVDPEVGNNAFTAVFDSQIGERITAVSSAVGCTLTVDEAKREGRATCSVPLNTVRVDNDDTKTFGQWATNKKTDPKQCTFQVEVPVVKLPSRVEPKTPVAFTTEGRFTICGRPRDDSLAEHFQGTVIYLPAGTYGAKRTLRIRAKVEHFDREKYGVSPKNTAGWLARVQQLAPVVGTEGTIEVNLFATAANEGAGGQPQAE
jgi:hypothetical protein